MGTVAQLLCVCSATASVMLCNRLCDALQSLVCCAAPAFVMWCNTFVLQPLFLLYHNRFCLVLQLYMCCTAIIFVLYCNHFYVVLQPLLCRTAIAFALVLYCSRFCDCCDCLCVALQAFLCCKATAVLLYRNRFYHPFCNALQPPLVGCTAIVSVGYRNRFC